MGGEVPDGWQHTKVGSVATVQTGGTPSRRCPDFWDGQIRWMASGEINQRTVRVTSESLTPPGLENSNAKVFPIGTVMVAMNGQGRTRGRTARLAVAAACNQSLAAIQATDCLEQAFLFHVLDQSYEELRNLTGDGRSGLNLDLIRRFPLLLPPLTEQRAIAAVLDAIDEAIEQTEAVIAATETLRKALLHDLLTRGVPGRHTQWKHVPGIGTVPECWEVVRLGDVLVDIEAGKSPNCESRPARENEWGVLKVSALSWGEFLPNENKALPNGTKADPALEVRPGDLLVSRSNTPELVGRAVLVHETRPRLLLCDKTLRLVPNADRIDPHILLMFLTTRAARVQIESAATGSSKSMFNISQKSLSRIQIPLPEAAEQGFIAEMMRETDKNLNHQRDALRNLQSVKGAAADGLLTGRVRLELTEGVS